MDKDSIPLVAGPILSGAFMIFVPAFTELTFVIRMLVSQEIQNDRSDYYF